MWNIVKKTMKEVGALRYDVLTLKANFQLVLLKQFIHILGSCSWDPIRNVSRCMLIVFSIIVFISAIGYHVLSCRAQLCAKRVKGRIPEYTNLGAISTIEYRITIVNNAPCIYPDFNYRAFGTCKKPDRPNDGRKFDTTSTNTNVDHTEP